MFDRLIEAVSRSHLRAAFALFALSLALFVPGQFTLQPMDRDEPRFAQATKQMLETRDFVDIRFQDEARHKKPVGIYWLQSAAVAGAEALGITDARGQIGYYRIPSLIGAIIVVLATYWAGLAFLSRRMAVLAAALMAASILLGVEARLAKTDAVLTATVVVAMGALARVWFAHVAPLASARPGTGTILAFWLAIGIGVLIKGPITPLIPLIVVICLALRERSLAWAKPMRLGLGLAIVVAIAAPWLIAIAVKSGGAFFTESVGKDMLGKVGGVAEKHWGPPGAYAVAFWATFWPGAPLAALVGWFFWAERKDDAVSFLLAWIVPFWLVLEAMPTKLPHYVLPLYPAVAILTLLAAERSAVPERGWRLWTSAGLMLLIPLALLIGAPFAFLKFDGTLPISAMPLLGIATLLAALAARACLAADVRAATIWGILAAMPLTAAGFRFGMPELQAINLSRNLAATARVAECKDPRFATAGFREPSLVFLTRTDLRMISGGEVLAFLNGNEGDCRVAFVESRDEVEFLTQLPAVSTGMRLAGRVKGININGGRPLDIGVWIKR
ncbi:MAG: glycosyltransferase family 39 protein [Proteobacteria bacterium]|nr:glycosyltransferase family 39 protein [Pseudomonadota bacterium]